MAPKPPKPSQGLKQDNKVSSKDDRLGAKTPQTLSGIETKVFMRIGRNIVGAKTPQTLSGIETN